MVLGRGGGPVKLLLVDDDATLTAALRRGLTAEGFTVETAADGRDGVWRGREGGYDLILLDIMLPGANGYPVCAPLRRSRARTPILLLTANEGAPDGGEGPAPGADDSLRTPFSFPVLVARIHALRRRASLGGPAPLEVGELRLDLRARRAVLGREVLPLTARELELLTFLVRRAGRAVSKSEILAGVWDDAFDGAPNVVEVYVGRLRRKLGGGSPRIETVRGLGYRLER